MFIDVLDPKREPGRACWDNDTLYDERTGTYYAMFNLIRKQNGAYSGGYAVDLYRSGDGVHWQRFLKDAMPLESAHAGYSFHRFGDTWYYHPTCTTEEKGIHMKAFRSQDLINWESMGDAYDVFPDPKWYRERWDEMLVLDDFEDGRPVYYGYISSEVREEVGAPSCGLIKSYDGLNWEILPPPVIVWGRLPAQHMEVSFCEKLGGRYYLCLNGRLYLNSLGYSLYTFVAEHPQGPFYPDEQMFRLLGNSNSEITWLSHTLASPDGPLCATWLSADEKPSIPSTSFTIAPFTRLVCKDGHIRLAYWQGNDAAKGEAIPIHGAHLAHPLPEVREERDLFVCNGRTLHMEAARDGMIAILDNVFDANAGFILEGTVRVLENRTNIMTHHHAAWFGVCLLSDTRRGEAMVVSTHAVCVSGQISFDDHPIGQSGFMDDVHAAQDLHSGRSGASRGLMRFDMHDMVQPLGHANAPDLRHAGRHTFRLLARGRYFQLFIDDYYVQTGLIPRNYRGILGIVACDGIADMENLCAWRMNLTD